MQHQQAISAELLAARVGQTIEVLVDAVGQNGAIARSHWDAPEIDGQVYLNTRQILSLGTASAFLSRLLMPTTSMHTGFRRGPLFG